MAAAGHYHSKYYFWVVFSSSGRFFLKSLCYFNFAALFAYFEFRIKLGSFFDPFLMFAKLGRITEFVLVRQLN